jgi:hypothetical protein
MSELKGQLLGILLVITVFGLLTTSLMPVFKAEIKKASDTVGEIDNSPNPEEQPLSTQNNQYFDLNNLLTY